MTRRRGSVAMLAFATTFLLASAAGAQESTTSTTLDIEATVLNVEATIIDLEGGTRTTESPDEVTVALDADVFFDFDESALRDDALAALDDLITQMDSAGVDEVTITGHTDDVGTDTYNQELSEDRAQAVEAYLADHLGGVHLRSEGRGADDPIAPNQTGNGEDYPEGRALNRRVEITYAGD